MLPKISTQSGYPPITNRPRGWQSYLNSLVALVVLIGGLGGVQKVWGQRFSADSLVINASSTGVNSTSILYYGKGGTPIFGGPIGYNIDPFNNSGTLAISSVGIRANPLGSNVVNANLYYRVYLKGTTVTNLPTYTRVPLNPSSTRPPNTSKAIFGSTQPIDLLTVPRVTGGGTYVVDVYFDFKWVDGTDSEVVNDQSTGPSAPYSATFTVDAPAVTPSGSRTVWQSTSNTDWFLSNNWSNGVPTGAADAVIPENTAGTNIVFPVLNDRTKNYSVRNLTLNGTTNSGRAQVSVQNAVLHVYGNIQQLSGGLVGSVIGNVGVADSTQNSTLVLKGSDQYITGRLNMPDVIVSGTGIKSVANSLLVNNVITFSPTDLVNGVRVQSASSQPNQDGTVSYVFDTTGNSLVDLGAFGKIDSLAGKETNVSYILGVVAAKRAFVNGNVQRFGNIGVDFVPNHDAAAVAVQRIIGDPLIGPTRSTPNVTPVPIKRQFFVSGDNGSDTNASSDIVFHYLNSAFELNTIKEENLTMFYTPTGAAPYMLAGGTLDQTNKTVTRVDFPTVNREYYLTLGDKTNPLPVSLVAFGAVRSGTNALLSWTTASEERNTGFNVQVSSDGTNFRTLSFVASQSPNSSTTLNYKYIDTEAGKTGTRYYRLEQVDEDGKKNYSPVRILSFNGDATGTGVLVAYPNPFSEGLSLSLDGGSVVDGTAIVKIVDMTGRTVRESKLPLVGASLTLNDMSALRSGLYLAKVTLPDGSTQTVRISKQ